MGGAVDESEALGCGFELVGFCPVFRAFLGVEAGFARDDVGFVPVVSFFSSLPDGVFEVAADSFGGEEFS